MGAAPVCTHTRRVRVAAIAVGAVLGLVCSGAAATSESDVWGIELESHQNISVADLVRFRRQGLNTVVIDPARVKPGQRQRLVSLARRAGLAVAVPRSAATPMLVGLCRAERRGLSRSCTLRGTFSKECGRARPARRRGLRRPEDLEAVAAQVPPRSQDEDAYRRDRSTLVEQARSRGLGPCGRNCGGGSHARSHGQRAFGRAAEPSVIPLAGQERPGCGNENDVSRYDAPERPWRRRRRGSLSDELHAPLGGVARRSERGGLRRLSKRRARRHGRRAPDRPRGPRLRNVVHVLDRRLRRCTEPVAADDRRRLDLGLRRWWRRRRRAASVHAIRALLLHVLADEHHDRVEPVDRQRRGLRLRRVSQRLARRIDGTADLDGSGPRLRNDVLPGSRRLRRSWEPLHQGSGECIHACLRGGRRHHAPVRTRLADRDLPLADLDLRVLDSVHG